MAKSAKKAAAPRKTETPLPQLQELYKFMVEQKLETVEYDHQGLRMRLVRQRTAPAQVLAPVPLYAGGAAPALGTGGAPAPSAPAAAAENAVPAGATTIKAPMMGIFYRASSPSSPPFAKRGDSVKRGHVLCLIEAMKVFNEIKADFDCVIETVLLENGKPVKAGQDLYVVTRK